MDNKIYNEEIKMDFLKGYEEDTAKTYQYALVKAADTERLFEKDLYDFSLADIRKVMFDINPNTINHAISIGSIFKTYINWAIENGYRMSNINPLDLVQPSWYEQFIDKTKKLYISEEELDYIISNLVNAQDAVILQLLFLGVRGYKSSEILNLKKDDIDWENGILHLRDDRKGERELVLPEESREKILRLLRQALNETEYQKRNGESKALNPILKLIESDHVVRNAVTRTEGSADEHLVYRRITTIKEIFNFPFINPINIERSGMIKLAKDIYLRDGKLENEQLKEVAKYFNIEPRIINGKETYNYVNLRQYLNLDVIKSLYDI